MRGPQCRWPPLVSVTHPGFLAGLEDPPGVFIVGSVCRWCLRVTAGPGGAARGDPACPSGSDLQSSHCTLGEAFEDLDWETEKGLEAVACDTVGFVPPKVMVRLGVFMLHVPSVGGGEGDFFLQEPSWLYLKMMQPSQAAQQWGATSWGLPLRTGSEAARP